MGVAIALTAVTGCRRGEVIGLRWTDVDWEAETLRVERAWVSGTGGQHLTTTKTKGSKRTVSVSGYGITVLRPGTPGRWPSSASSASGCCRQRRDRTPAGEGRHADVTKLAKDHGISAHFHDLRHFASTQLQGMTDQKTAASRLGHTPRVMLDTYAHAIAERDAAASRALGDVLTKTLEAGPPSYAKAAPEGT